MFTKKLIVSACILVAFTGRGQQTSHIDEKGSTLRNFYLSLNVENLWISGHHINWQTGQQDNPKAEHGIHTHCSAFAAAACKKLNIYLLRPPDHGQLLLANAQYDWLQTQEARDHGWKPVREGDIYAQSQQLANQGYIVLAIYKNPNPKIPGHVALVMPDELSKRKLEEFGPSLIMAGTHNHNRISLREGFKSHIHSWPEQEILFYYYGNLPAY
jgi:hypothetical protein